MNCQGGKMKHLQTQQLVLFHRHPPSPVSIPPETRRRVSELIGELLAEYWRDVAVDECEEVKRDRQDMQ